MKRNDFLTAIHEMPYAKDIYDFVAWAFTEEETLVLENWILEDGTLSYSVEHKFKRFIREVIIPQQSEYDLVHWLNNVGLKYVEDLLDEGIIGVGQQASLAMILRDALAHHRYEFNRPIFRQLMINLCVQLKEFSVEKK